MRPTSREWTRRLVCGLGALLLMPVAPLAGEAGSRLLISGAVVFDGRQWFTDASIVVDGERIARIEQGPVDSDSRTTTIDASRWTVLPGLIDAHAHLLSGGEAQPGSDREWLEYREHVLPGILRQYLEVGVTTVMSNGDFWPEILEVRSALESGELTGPRLIAAGPMVSAPGGHPGNTMCLERGRTDFWCRRHLAVEIDRPAAADEAVGRLAASGVDAVKVVYDDLASRRIRKMSAATARRVIDEAHRAGLPVYAHVYDPDDAREMIRWGIDGLVHAPGSAIPDRNRELVAAMKASGTTAASTIAFLDFAVAHTNARSSRRRLSGARVVSRELADADLLAFGTDAPRLGPTTAVYREMELLIDLGLTPTQVLSAATRIAARHIGRGDSLGTIAPGNSADFVVIDGDPRSDLTALKRVVLVILAGRLVADHRD